MRAAHFANFKSKNTGSDLKLENDPFEGNNVRHILSLELYSRTTYAATVESNIQREEHGRHASKGFPTVNGVTSAILPMISPVTYSGDVTSFALGKLFGACRLRKDYQYLRSNCVSRFEFYRCGMNQRITQGKRSNACRIKTE